MSKTICVFAASSPPSTEDYGVCLKYLGQLIAERGYHLVMGGMANGCMGLIGQSFLRHGGHATIVTPVEYVSYEEGFTHERLLRETAPDVMERIRIFIAKSDGFITCPGGMGSIGEAPHVIADNQASLYHVGGERKVKPHVFYNFGGFYNPLILQYDMAFKHGYIKDEQMALINYGMFPADVILKLDAAMAEVDRLAA